MQLRILRLIATAIGRCEPERGGGRGHPHGETVRVLATLRRFLREGTPWRSLATTEDHASGSTLRRCLVRWSRSGPLARVRAMLVGMLRGHPDLVFDSCSVRAKRGTKYHIAAHGDGVPVACTATAANVNDTVMFERLFLCAFAVTARIRAVTTTRGATPSVIALCAAGSAPSPASTSAVGYAGQGWEAALAGRALQRLDTGEQAPRPPLRPARLRHPGAAPSREHIPGCRTARPRILKNASHYRRRGARRGGAAL